MTKLCLVGSNIFMLGQEGQEDRMRLLRISLTEQGQVDQSVPCTCTLAPDPFISCSLFTSDCRVNGVRCVCASCIGQYSQPCAITTTQQGCSPESVSKPTYTETGPLSPKLTSGLRNFFGGVSVFAHLPVGQVGEGRCSYAFQSSHANKVRM